MTVLDYKIKACHAKEPKKQQLRKSYIEFLYFFAVHKMKESLTSPAESFSLRFSCMLNVKQQEKE
jgi:hypothetical protein